MIGDDFGRRGMDGWDGMIVDKGSLPLQESNAHKLCLHRQEPSAQTHQEPVGSAAVFPPAQRADTAALRRTRW